MNKTEILARVDHTLLKATATWSEICKLCEEAIQYKTASVCIPPSYLEQVREEFPTLKLCTVVGFPMGYSTTACKIFEAVEAVADGANEIDMVVNLCLVKNGEFDLVQREIEAVREAVSTKVFKVIVETCYLTEQEKVELCRCITRAGADFVKTSTGFGTGGASLADIELFKQNIGKDVRIKASGGIRTAEEMLSYCEAGCDRIGCSGAIAALT